MSTLLSLAPCTRSPLFRRLVPSRSFFLHHRVRQQPCPTAPVQKDFASYFFRNDNWDTRHPVRVANSPVEHLPTFRETAVLTPKRLLSIYAQLAKTRLTVLVVLTTASGVALSPMPTTLPVLLSTTLGTALCSASANTLNQLQEVPYDAQMSRTRQRPLVRRAISPLHATCFAVATGIAGPVLLWTMTNPLTAAIGAANICLYAGLYTYLKRKSILNTWVGAVVGGLPPLMGWTACGGKLLPTSDYPVTFFLPPFLADIPPDASMIDNPLGALALFMLLYSWQFPHFNALSHVVRASYAQAGYRMLSVLSPQKNALVSLRHAVLLVPICSVLFPLSGLTTWTFTLTSFLPNCLWVRAAVAFWRSCGEKQARSLFHASLWYLPLMLALMMVHKQGVDWADWGMGKGSDTLESGSEGTQRRPV